VFAVVVSFVGLYDLLRLTLVLGDRQKFGQISLVESNQTKVLTVND
jgi:hypothetical protein